MKMNNNGYEVIEMDDNRIKYILKHKDIDVALLEFSEEGRLLKIKETINGNHYPPGVMREDGKINENNLYTWWDDRGLPKTREMVYDVLREAGETSRDKLLIACNGLSLSDHYWIVSEKSNIKWKNINFYENKFNNDVGDLFFYKRKKNKKYDLRDPGITSGGNLRKKWIIEEDEKRVMIKGGKSPYFQEVPNEVIATILCRKLNISHVPYSLSYEENDPVCRCVNMTSNEVELIHAYNVFNSLPRNINDTLYKHYLKSIHNLNITQSNENKVIGLLDRMFVLDYLIYNHDRHFNNFGIIRNSTTLECMGPAPVYDSGTSLFHDKSIQMMFEKDRFLKTDRGFNTLDKQLSLVSDWSWYRGKILDGLGDECMEIFSRVSTVEHDRAKKITEIVGRRIQLLNMTIDKKLNGNKESNNEKRGTKL
jgi:hypothetical protein